mmetsp:Transcript_56467/g.122799  ORF Transcript_56467/g.122799 Transcript_56467/m.122799 type:complete len:99 (+) Transcript_56467:88-384(+)
MQWCPPISIRSVDVGPCCQETCDSIQVAVVSRIPQVWCNCQDLCACVVCVSQCVCVKCVSVDTSLTTHTTGTPCTADWSNNTTTTNDRDNQHQYKLRQ